MNTNVPENQSTRHTPGPWRKRDHGFIYAPDGEHFETLVARVGAFHDEELLPFSRERWTADAHLIAAAPELLAALRAMEAMYTHAWDRTDGGLLMMPGSVERFDAACEKARATIAKATGAQA